MAPKSHPKKSTVSTGGSSSQTSSKAEKKLTTFDIGQINDMTNHLRDEYGEGQFAKVYKGELYSEAVAVKVYKDGKRNLAENEINALTDLISSSHIIPLRGTCVHDGIHYLVMKFVSRNLEQLLKESELNWPETLKILVQLANAIKAVIREDYVVADIKPDNVLIDEGYNVFLCDFGSARKEGRDIPTINKLYTPKEVYLSSSRSQLTSKTDIYSYGCILLQMIMKYNAFPKRDFQMPLTVEVSNHLKPKVGKKGRRAPNSSNVSNPHVSVQARILCHRHGHVVHKHLIQSGCGEDDAKKITELGINCTNEEVNQRPSIEDVISTIEQLKVRKMKY